MAATRTGRCAARTIAAAPLVAIPIISDRREILIRTAEYTAEFVQEQDVYARVGESGIARVVAAFYRRVPGDDVLGPMYPPEDLEGAEQRLRDFLIYRFGGPQHYIEQRGHPRLRARHGRFAIDSRARDRWMRLMTDALAEAGLPADVEDVMRTFLDGIATFLINRAQT
jgi:hemoglobin